MGRAGRWRDFFNSIKGKIFALFLIAFPAAGGLAALNVRTLAALPDPDQGRAADVGRIRGPGAQFRAHLPTFIAQEDGDGR